MRWLKNIHKIFDTSSIEVGSVSPPLESGWAYECFNQIKVWQK